MFDNLYFSEKELACKCCGEVKIDDYFLHTLIEVRKFCAFPFIVTSGYRCEKHNKSVGGARNSGHTKGKAVDIRCWGDEALKVVQHAALLGITGIGLSQRTTKPCYQKFIHLDTMDKDEAPRPNIWTY